MRKRKCFVRQGVHMEVGLSYQQGLGVPTRESGVSGLMLLLLGLQLRRLSQGLYYLHIDYRDRL